MRLLLVSPFVPDRNARHGGGSYLGNLCEALAEHADLGLCALTGAEDQPPENGSAIQWSWQAQLPVPERPRQGIPLLGHQLRMAWRWGAQRRPLVAAKYWHPGMPALLARACREFQPDAALVELAQMAQYLPCLRSIPTILTDHEAGVPANAHTNLGSWADQRDQRLWQTYLRKHYPLAGSVQAVTQEDADVLEKQLGRNVTTRLPTIAVPKQPAAPDRAPARALFLGSYAHAPNPQAAGILAREVLPRLRKLLPDAELWFAGHGCERIEELGATEGVKVCGFVPDLNELYSQVRVMLAPLYSGGGFRMKSLSALAHGLPVVTNQLGGRGCSAPAPARILAESADELAAATAKLMESKELARQASETAHRWALENLEPGVVARSQIERVRQLLEG
ncbi:MAG: glycosyltransferase [Planctomycetota bacterium]|nr:glycosyltransferase [Planctomycetota bacterium]